MNSNSVANRSQAETVGVAFSMFTPNAWAVTTLAAAIGLAMVGLATAMKTRSLCA